MENSILLGIDIAKNIFQLHGVTVKGKPVLKKKLSRKHLLPFLANLPACTIAMEACGGANYWVRQFQKLGHEVKLISPQFVKPFVKSNKNDRNDAEAITEAASRPTMRFVPIKNVEQQDIQCLHRIRSQRVAQRTALGNQIRGFLMEYGEIIAQGIAHVRKRLPEILEDATNELTFQAREFFQQLYEELLELDKKIKDCDLKIENIFKSNEHCQKIAKVEGIGPITATAIVSAVGDPKVFKNGRQMAAWLGLVPRQHSSGGKTTLGGMSKRGDGYLRMLFIHGARAVVQNCDLKKDSRSRWIQSKKANKGVNKTSVAVANKNARIVWALLAYEERYQKAA